MNASAAASLINQELIFRPGWQLRAVPFENLGVVLVEASVLTNNLDREEAPDYRSQIIAGGSFEVPTGGTEAEFLKRLIGEFLKIEEHEWREALRFKPNRPHGDYVAPFHPHRPEGIRNWNAA